MYLPSSVDVVVIHCGTNNVDANVYTPHDIAHGVISCGVKLRENHLICVLLLQGYYPWTYMSPKGESKYSKLITF